MTTGRGRYASCSRDMSRVCAERRCVVPLVIVIRMCPLCRYSLSIHILEIDSLFEWEILDSLSGDFGNLCVFVTMVTCCLSVAVSVQLFNVSAGFL